MATRFYTSATRLVFWPGTYEPTGGLPAEPAFSASWESTVQFPGGPQIDDRRDMFPWRTNTDTDSFTVSETSTSVHDVLLAQYISPPLATQTISGTIHGIFNVRESSTGGDMRAQMVAWVVKPDGTSRGTLLAESTAALSNEFSTTTTNGGPTRRFPVNSTGTAISSVNAIDGDRIVVEIGYRTHNTSATSFATVLTARDYSGTSPYDHSTTESATVALNSWIEFSADLTFQTMLALSDSIAGAVDAMPASGESTITMTTAFDTFTTETDDPEEMDDYLATVSGWVKLVGPTGGARVTVGQTFGVNVYGTFFLYDETPVDSSVSLTQVYDFEEPVVFEVPEGETRWIGALANNGGFVGGDDTNYAIHVYRWPLAAIAGDLADDIGDAVGVFPTSQATEEVYSTTRLDAFTTETDDPDEIEDYAGDPWPTAWLKLEVPVGGALTSISIEEPTDVYDLVFWLYDEVPTASSVAIAFDDYTDPDPDHDWPSFGYFNLAAGTYYLCIVPGFFDLGTFLFGPGYDISLEGSRVSVKVRWEAEPTIADFDLDAIIRKTVVYPGVPPVSVIRDFTTASSAGATELTLDVPALAQSGDLLLAFFVLNEYADWSFIEDDPDQGWFWVDSWRSDADDGLQIVVMSYDTALNTETSQWDWYGGTDHLTFTSYDSLPIAAAMIAFDKAQFPWDWNDNRLFTPSTFISTPLIGGFAGSPGNESHYEEPTLFLGVFAGDGAGTWSVDPQASEITPATELLTVDVSGASLHIQTRYDIYDSFASSFIAHNTVAVPPLAAWMSIVNAPTGRFRVAAALQPGGGFFINSFLQAATHTTHLRTGPHFDTHPSTFVITSATLGSLPPGTDLNTVIADLDDLLTDLERKE